MSAVAMNPASLATPRSRLQSARGVVVSSRATGRLAANSALRPVALAASFASRHPSRAAARVAFAGSAPVASRAAPFRRRSSVTPAASSGATGGLVAQVPAENLPTNYFDKSLDDEDDDAVIDLSLERLARGRDALPVPYLRRAARHGDPPLRRRLLHDCPEVHRLAVPILFKFAVDHLTAAAVASADSNAVAASLRAAAWALVASGAFKAVSGLATELRSVAFTPVAQAAGRRVALQVFRHVLNLDLSFHLDRRTGALQRIIDRGTRSITMVFRAVVFTFLPTAVELTLVCALLWRAFSGTSSPSCSPRSWRTSGGRFE